MFGKFFKIYLLSLLLGSYVFFFLGKNALLAQTFPVISTTTLSPPISPFLSQIPYSGLMLNILLIENRTDPLPIRIELVMEAPSLGIELRTKPSFRFERELLSGAPLILFGEELKEFFYPQNLDFKGINQQEIQRTKTVPESFAYQFSFRIYELASGRETLISNPDLGRFIAPIYLIAPPIITLPRPNAIENPQNLENIPLQFQWIRSPNAGNVVYDFVLSELHDEQQAKQMNSSQGLFTVGQPIYQTETFSTNLLYGQTGEPVLELGKFYAFQVRIRDPLDRSLFSNQGLSEVVVFQWGSGCNEIQELEATALNHREIAVKWESQAGQTDYMVESRRAGTEEWYPTKSPFTDATIDELEPSTEYEIRVIASCNALNSDASEIIRVRTLTPPEVDFTCGTPEEVIIENQEVKEGRLRIGDKFYSANFEILVTMVKPSESGKHSGIGWARIPAFQALQLVVEYENIILNTSNEHIGGTFYASRDDWYLYEPIEIAGGQNIQVSGNKISIRTGSGELRELPLGEKYVLSDPDWTYQVDEEGAVTYIPKEPVDYGEMTDEELNREAKRLEEEVAKSGNLKEAAKLAKVKAEQGKRLLGKLGDLIRVMKDAIEDLKGTSEARRDSLEMKKPVLEDSLGMLVTLSLTERKESKPELGGGSNSSRDFFEGDLPEEGQQLELESNNPTFQKWSPLGSRIKRLIQEIDIEKFKFEELLTMSGDEVLQGLAGDLTGDLEELGNGLLTRFMEEDEGYEELKAYIIEWFNEKLNERISTIYNLEDNDNE